METINCGGTQTPVAAAKRIRALKDGRLFVELKTGARFVGEPGSELQATEEDLDPFSGKDMKSYAVTPEGPVLVSKREPDHGIPSATKFGVGGLKMTNPSENK